MPDEATEPSVPPAFVEQVEDALKHIYDLPYLNDHPLASELAGEGPAAESRGQHLRRELVAAIEALSPGPKVPFRALHARTHSILVLHYMEQMTIHEAANQLGISPRQAIRNLRDAERSVAAVLWSARPVMPPDEANAVRLSSLDAEIGYLEAASCPTDIGELVRSAVEAVRPRAAQRTVDLSLTLPSDPVMFSTNPTLAQQLVVGLVNHAVGQSHNGPVAVGLETVCDGIVLIITYEPATDDGAGAPLKATVHELGQRLGWSISQEVAEEVTRLRCAISHPCPSVLIVDDNEGLVNLLQRYLADRSCRVLTARSGEEGLQRAREHRPDVIILDVMMPGMHGWEVLQRLRSDPHTAEIRVVICSVVNEPELAQALGAALFLPKPIRQADVLTALRQLGIL
jgi:CheY-like chemotaxis protein